MLVIIAIICIFILAIVSFFVAYYKEKKLYEEELKSKKPYVDDVSILFEDEKEEIEIL